VVLVSGPILQSGIDAVKAETPSQFRVGATWDGQVVSGGVSYDRSWKNGFGLTAYARAYWNDTAVIPTNKYGVVVGAEGVWKFGGSR
jgi:hypothetical protein